MEEKPKITVHKQVAVLPTTVLATDADGRPTSVMCPTHSEPAAVHEDGRITCPTCDALDALLAEAHDRLVAAAFGTES